MRRLALLLVLLAPLAAAPAGAQTVERVEPAFWWAEMRHASLQVMLYGEDVGRARVTLAPHAGVALDRVTAVESPNYLFLDLTLAPDAAPGTLVFTLDGPDGTQTLDYSLRQRARAPGSYAQGFSSADVIYLMMPDRFANADPANDAVAGMLEGVDRQDPNARQGGDFEGVRRHLDYIADLGMTAIWFTPVFENDMTPEYGAYHGYAATDMYRVDRRFGTNGEFAALVEACHARGLKVIMDMIHNHIGDRHWWMDDPPTPDWVHSWERYGQTNYAVTAPVDPYAAEADVEGLVNGWFVAEMPDLNQDNDLLATYLLQNTVWWIEHTGIDGIRMDTYPYPDKAYMARWAAHVLHEYPAFNIVGEAWMPSAPAHGVLAGRVRRPPGRLRRGPPVRDRLPAPGCPAGGRGRGAALGRRPGPPLHHARAGLPLPRAPAARRLPRQPRPPALLQPGRRGRGRAPARARGAPHAPPHPPDLLRDRVSPPERARRCRRRRLQADAHARRLARRRALRLYRGGPDGPGGPDVRLPPRPRAVAEDGPRRPPRADDAVRAARRRLRPFSAGTRRTP